MKVKGMIESDVDTFKVGADQIVQWDTRYGEMTGKDNAICEE